MIRKSPIAACAFFFMASVAVVPAIASDAHYGGYNVYNQIGDKGAEMAGVPGPVRDWGRNHSQRNLDISRNESGYVDKEIARNTGISRQDMRDHGWTGGPNSFINKPLGNFRF